ncbi:hypothetical protein E4U52_007745 [Claviceps spartinae]|nr:hypothetical protein E4U52_007745 [Claviceps spartinae]
MSVCPNERASGLMSARRHGWQQLAAKCTNPEMKGRQDGLMLPRNRQLATLLDVQRTTGNTGERPEPGNAAAVRGSCIVGADDELTMYYSLPEY